MKTQSALCAAMIRKTLKGYFPTTIFRVTSDNYSGGNSVNVSWKNGPTVSAVEGVIGHHEAGTFDGMTDMYTYDNDRSDIPQCKYLFCNRRISQDVLDAVTKKESERWGDWQSVGSYEQERRVYQAILELGAL